MKTEDIVKHMSEISGLTELEVSEHEMVYLECTLAEATISTGDEVLWQGENPNESYLKTREFLGEIISETLHYRRVCIILTAKEYPTVSLDVLVVPQ